MLTIIIISIIAFGIYAFFSIRKARNNIHYILFELPEIDSGYSVLLGFYLIVQQPFPILDEAWEQIKKREELIIGDYSLLLAGKDLWINNEPKPTAESKEILLKIHEKGLGIIKREKEYIKNRT